MFIRIRNLLLIQLALVLLTSVVFLGISGNLGALSACFGGLIACSNAVLLEWRRYRVDRGRALSGGASLRALYRSALERFLLVALLFALGMGVLRLEPLALLSGFIAGHVGLVISGLRRKN